MSDKSTSGIKIITINRKASFNFFFKEILEAGIVLKGSEIKSVRDGKINIAESYAVEKEGEIFLINSHIPIYKQASYSNHNPYSERKLLFNKREQKHFWHPIFCKGQTWPTETPFKLILQASNNNQKIFEIIIGETQKERAYDVIFENGLPKLSEIQNAEEIIKWV